MTQSKSYKTVGEMGQIDISTTNTKDEYIITINGYNNVVLNKEKLEKFINDLQEVRNL